MKRTKQLLAMAIMAGTGFLSVVGCAGEVEPGLAPVPEGLEPRPALESVPDNAVRVAVMQGGGDFTYDLVRGQRYYLVDESADRLLTSEVADEDGEISVGEEGATFAGDQIWDGSVDTANQVALYVSRELEQP